MGSVLLFPNGGGRHVEGANLRGGLERRGTSGLTGGAHGHFFPMYLQHAAGVDLIEPGPL